MENQSNPLNNPISQDNKFDKLSLEEIGFTPDIDNQPSSPTFFKEPVPVHKPQVQPQLIETQKKKEVKEYGKKSHLEYLKFIQCNKDPINVQYKGGIRKIKLEEVKQHKDEKSLWSVLDGKVYDLTVYLDYHPGGAKKLLMGAGKDMTSLFNKYHPWVNYEALISKLQIGTLEREE